MFLRDHRDTPCKSIALDRSLRSRSWSRFRRTGNEGGAALVEFALILPLLVTLVLGSVDIGFYLNDAGKLRSAVREAGRRAATAAYGSTQCPSGVGQGNPASFTSSSRATETSKILCLTKLFAYESNLDAQIATRVVSFDSSGVVQAGTDKPFTEENAVVICAQVQSRSRTGLLAPLLNSRVIQSRVVMRIAQTVATGPGQSEETPYSGNWDQCEVTT